MDDLRLREGAFVETVDGLIFEVKGLVHPADRIIAFLRYIPDPKGDRTRDGKKFTKIYGLTEKYKFIRSNYPEYLFYDWVRQREMQGVPYGMIKKIYCPQEKLRTLMKQKWKDKTETTAVKFATAIAKNAVVSLEDIGISGSILVDLRIKNSDIDLVVYGKKNGLRIYKWLEKTRTEGGWILPYDEKSVKKVCMLRWGKSGLPVDKLIEIEKVLQGLVDNKDYFIRLVRGWGDINRVYSDLRYVPLGKATIVAKIVDDRDSIFTPCKYVIEKCEILSGKIYGEIREICSFRGKFTEQARAGDWVAAKGKIEKVITKEDGHFRLLLESVEDYMVKVNGR